MKEENCMTLAWVLASLNLLIGAMRLLTARNLLFG
jgi:hypothetical protein